jgi:hypothetical protein
MQVKPNSPEVPEALTIRRFGEIYSVGHEDIRFDQDRPASRCQARITHPDHQKRRGGLAVTSAGDWSRAMKATPLEASIAVLGDASESFASGLLKLYRSAGLDTLALVIPDNSDPRLISRIKSPIPLIITFPWRDQRDEVRVRQLREGAHRFPRCNRELMGHRKSGGIVVRDSKELRSTIGSATSHVLTGRGLATCQTPPTMSPVTSPGLLSFAKV